MARQRLKKALVNVIKVRKTVHDLSCYNFGHFQSHDCLDSVDEDMPLRQTRLNFFVTEEYGRYMNCIMTVTLLMQYHK